MKQFPCIQCGACCRHVNLSELTAYLDRGDGICHHHDTLTHLCKIYEKRPEVCQINTYYDKHLKQDLSWDKFVELNLIACKQLNELDDV